MALNQEAWGSFYLDDDTGCVGYHLTAVYGRHVDKDWIAGTDCLSGGCYRRLEEKGR